MKHIILLPCSKNKTNALSPTKAIELYDGPFYRVIRKAQRNDNSIEDKFEILILSAKYGLIFGSELILPYEKRLTRKEAINIRNEITSKLTLIIKEGDYNILYSFLGSYYRQAIVWGSINLKTVIISDSIGIMQSKLKNLLN